MTDLHHLRLTDELERQLMRREIEEQFRPRPLRALGRLLKTALRRLSASRGSAWTDKTTPRTSAGAV